MAPMNLLRVVATVSGMTLLSRITGLVREIVQAALFGASDATDAFNVAFRIPNLLRRLFAEGAFAQAFVPILGEFKTRRGEAETGRLIDDTATALTWVLFGVTTVGVVGAPVLVWLLGSGLEKRTDGTFDMAVLMTRIMFPYILFVSLVAAASGVLNTWRQFAVPAFTPVLLNVSIIAAAVWLTPYCHPPILALAVGVAAGGVLQLAIQIPPLASLGVLPRYSTHLWTALSNPGVRRILKQMLPATLAVSVAQLSLIINVNIATRLGTGAVSWLSYADRLMEFPTALLGVALGTVLTPSLSEARAEGNDERYGELLDWGMRLAVLLALPCAVALWLIATPLTATLFERGHFSALDVEETRRAVAAYGTGLIGLILVKILAPGFYARQDIRTPVKIGIGVLIATQAMNLLFVPLFAQAGLALSTSLGACANAAMLYSGLHRRGALRPRPGWGLFLVRVLVGLAVLAGVLWWGAQQYDWIAPGGHPWLRVVALAALVAGGAVAYLVTLLATGLKLKEFTRRI